MDDIANRAAPPGWLEALAEGEADIAAGRIVPAETVHRLIRESLAETRRAPGGKTEAQGDAEALIAYAAAAQRQIDALVSHYGLLGRSEAIRNLDKALSEAESRVLRDPTAGLPAPRPYPSLARPGRAWIKVGRYWIAYSLASGPLIVCVFHDSADIPNRL